MFAHCCLFIALRLRIFSESIINVVFFSWKPIEWHVEMSIYPLTVDFNFDPLVKMVSADFSTKSDNFPLFVFNIGFLRGSLTLCKVSFISPPSSTNSIIASLAASCLN